MSNNILLNNKLFKNKSIVLVVIISLLLLIQGCYNKDNIEVWFITDGARYDTVIVNDKATLPVEPVKEGYVFCGWYFDDNTFNDRLTVESFKDNLLTTNKSVYAKWVKVNGVNNTDIILDTFEKRTDDYYLHVKNDIDTINLDELITISPASKYIISTDSVFTNTIDKVVNLNIGDNTYYVKVINENTLENVIYTLSIYRNKMFEVTLISYDNNVYKVIEVEEDSLLTLKDITREHYTFDGWNYDLTKPVKDNLTIHAKWNPISYEITYISDDKVIKKELLPYDSDISYLANKDYNTFDGWYSDETYSYPVTKVTNDMSVYAKWNLLTYVENGMTYIYYGKYPQSVVLDNTLISELNTLTTTNSNGYYEYNGKEYVKVIANPLNNEYKFSDNDTIIVKDTTYYFLVEPIKWRVLNDISDEYFLLSEHILDKHEFYSYIGIRTIDGKTIYPSNYEYSVIREWLNNDFYNKVFNSKEKKLIKETLVDNSASTTNSNTNKHVCDNTLDKVFLLSYQDMMNTSYGFSSNYNESTTREVKLTDYARAIGCIMSINSLYYGNGRYWLRSPCSNYESFAYNIRSDGYVYSDGTIFNYTGIRVAIIIEK